ncbi:unnamed protein product [Urochloa humidicola]
MAPPFPEPERALEQHGGRRQTAKPKRRPRNGRSRGRAQLRIWEFGREELVVVEGSTSVVEANPREFSILVCLRVAPGVNNGRTTPPPLLFVMPFIEFRF